MKEISFQEGLVRYRTDGKGKPVVFLHGFCADHKVWNDFKQDLVEERYKVICIDLPGFGLSTPLKNPSIDGYADAVLAVIDALGYEKVLLVGHSMGGYTALALAEKRPEILSGLVMFHSHPYTDLPEKKVDRLKQITFIQRQGHALYVKQAIPRFFAEGYVRSRPFDADKLIHRAARFPEVGITGALQAMIDRPDRSEVLESIPCPVSFILGEEDRFIPKEKAHKQLVLPKIAQVSVLPKVGHLGMVESRKATQLIVRQFAVFCENYWAEK